MFVDEDNGDVDNIPSDGEGLDGNDETSDESEADSDVSQVICERNVLLLYVNQSTWVMRSMWKMYCTFRFYFILGGDFTAGSLQAKTKAAPMPYHGLQVKPLCRCNYRFETESREVILVYLIISHLTALANLWG